MEKVKWGAGFIALFLGSPLASRLHIMGVSSITSRRPIYKKGSTADECKVSKGPFGNEK